MKLMKKLTTIFEASDYGNVINKAYLDEKFFLKKGHLPLLEKDYNEYKSQYNKQSVEEILVQRVVKTTTQILYVRGLFDGFPIADKVSDDFLFVTRRRPDLQKVNDDDVH